MSSVPAQGEKREVVVPEAKERHKQETPLPTEPEKLSTSSTTSETETEQPPEPTEDDTKLIPASLLAASQLECQTLRKTVTQLQRDLHDAQDFVFSLQPRQQTLTEAEAVEEFQALCAAVEEWVDQKLGDSLDEMTIVERPRPKDIQNLMDLIPQPGKHAFNIPETDVDNIQATILRYLCDCIFSQDFYCPLPKEEREFLTMVERSMRALQPRRDLRTCRHWRVETYTALSERPGFPQYATNRMWDLTVDIIKMLRVFAPDTDHQKLAENFFETITKPASALARKMHLSFDEFSLDWTPHHDTPPDPRAFEKADFAHFEFVDLNSRKTLKEKPPPAADVRWMFDLTPKLVFRKLRVDSWAEGKVLARPRVLVSVAVDKEARKKERKAGPEGESEPTVLGVLDRWMQEYHAQMRQNKPGLKFFGYFS